VAVVGPSGSGKSSAVKAGLLPAVRDGAVPLSGSWFTIEMTPAPHPFEQLEDVLLSVAVDPPPSLYEQLASEHGLQRAIERVLPDDGSQLVLLIDQFEELFTQVEPSTASRFAANIVSAVTDERSRVRVVATLRADFYDRPLQHRGLGELLRDGTEIITPMTPQELERAITRPAEQHGVSFEPPLVAELLREVTDRAGALPLLQYTLTELFDSRHGDRIHRAAYEQLGGMSGALLKRSEGLLTSLGPGAEEVARQVFLRLVTFTEAGEDTRRRVLRSELEDLDVDRQLLRSVLDTFGRHRLLSFDRDPITRSPTVEISHEALLTAWGRLRGWIDGARDDVRMQRRLAEALREWNAAGRADAYLLRGGLLEQMQGWAATTSMQLSAPERALLHASVAERDREAGEVLQQEQRAVEAEERERRRGRQLLVVALVATFVAALGVFGAVQWRSALDAKGDVEDLIMVDDLISASTHALDDDPQLALLLAMQSVRETVDLGFATEEAVDAVHFALQELGVQYDVGDDTPVAVRSGPNGLVGVYALSPHALLELAESSVGRTLTAEECRTFLSGACPDTVDVPADLELRGGLDAYADARSAQPLTGTTVTISSSVLSDDDGFRRELIAFQDRTGIAVELLPPEAEATVDISPPEPTRRPDVVTFGGVIPGWVEQRAIDIGAFVDRDTLRSDFGDYVLSFGSSGHAGGALDENAPVNAIPISLDVKGLVFYPKAAFEAAGYQVPTTWDQLTALSDRIVADGRTPWCFGFESGGASGWPGTDLIESLVLRVGGIETYDAWIAGEIRFNSPVVLEAGRLADDLVFGPEYVRGGPAAISGESFEDQLVYMLARDATGEPEPECWLHQQAKFMLTWYLPPGARIGTDIDYFMLPPIVQGDPTPLIANPDFASALVDRPEVRAFMQFAASPDWGKLWATHEFSDFTSANLRFSVGTYGDGGVDRGDAMRTQLAGLARSAVQSGTLRIDASDAMPAAIGGEKDSLEPGAFWQGMLDWVDGVRSIDQIFADIDAEWAALRAGAATRLQTVEDQPDG
jgi:ABC-type glycerol-3-phosphate transport system substrate-binding protein